jgi:hypothetical protein
MGKVLLEMIVAVDGYVAGPDISPAMSLGRDGERLHESMFAGRSSAEFQHLETDHFRCGQPTRGLSSDSRQGLPGGTRRAACCEQEGAEYDQAGRGDPDMYRQASRAVPNGVQGHGETVRE